MSFVEFWQAMTKPEQVDFSERVGSTRGSLYYGYVYGDKTPRPEKLARMVERVMTACQWMMPLNTSSLRR